jgi:benzoylformate decarboxylase
VARAIFEAKRPVIIAGDEVSRTRAWGLLAALAERCRIPVFQEQGRSAVFWNMATTSPAYAGVYRSRDPRVAGADLILAVGPRLAVEFQPVDRPDVPPGARLIHVHRDPWELGKLYPAAIALRASAAEFLQALSGWLDQHPRDWQPFPPVASPIRGHEVGEIAGRPTVAAVVAALAETAPPHPVLVDEAVRSSPTVIDLYPLEPEGYFHSSGGGLGWGIPCAMGIKLAWPERPVVAVVGDGSLYFGIQALWTAARERIGVKILVLNNEKYLAVEAGLNTYRGGIHPEQGYLGVDLTNPAPDPVQIAAGFGVPAQRVEHGDDLRRALTWAFNHDGPALVDVRVADDPGR